MRYPLPITLLVISFAATIIVLYDCWLLARGGPGATISWHTYEASQREPIVPLLLGFLVGLLCGHLFWPNRGQ